MGIASKSKPHGRPAANRGKQPARAPARRETRPVPPPSEPPPPARPTGPAPVPMFGTVQLAIRYPVDMVRRIDALLEQRNAGRSWGRQTRTELILECVSHGLVTLTPAPAAAGAKGAKP